MMTFRAAILCTVILVGSATADVARELAPGAKVHFDAAQAAFAAGDFATAARELEAAYAIDADPTLLYAWATALRKAERCRDALAIYRRFLASNPAEADASAARQSIEMCEVAAEPVNVEPPPDPPPVPPPDVTPASRDGESPWYRDGVGGALVIGGTIGLATGSTFLVLARRSDDAAKRAVLRDDFIEHVDQATSRRRIGYAGLGVGGALVAAGILRYLMRDDGATPVTVTATDRAIVIVGRF